MEYCALVIMVLGILIVMKMVIYRGLAGGYKNAGDSFGFGRQYDPDNTIQCAYAQYPDGSGRWYDLTCYEHVYAICFKASQNSEVCRTSSIEKCLMEAMCDT